MVAIHIARPMMWLSITGNARCVWFGVNPARRIAPSSASIRPRRAGDGPVDVNQVVRETVHMNTIPLLSLEPAGQTGP